MSKKSRRLRTPNLPPEAYQNTAAADADSVAASVTAGTDAKASKESALDLRAEYAEVISDLRRTLLIFTAMVVAMLGLSFVLR
jgi:hypothetical protein